MTHPLKSWLVLLASFSVVVNPWPSTVSAASEDGAEEGISLEIDVFGASSETKDICYGRPTNWHPNLEAHFRRVFEGAANATRPEHATSFLRFLDTDDTTGCLHRLSSTLERGRKGVPRNLTVELMDEGEVRFEGSAGPLVPVRSRVDQLEPLWRDLWAVLAPEPAPPPEPEVEETYVDEDLLEARQTVEREPERRDRGPYITALVQTGLTHRSASIEPAVGREQELGALLSLGGQLDLHIGGMLGLDGHRIDGRVGYWRQLVTAEVEGQDVGTEADRLRGELIYGRRWLGPATPEIAAAFGVENRRFVFDETAQTVSSELTALRPGVDLEQVLFGRDEPSEVALLGGGRIRVPVGSDADDFDVGFDAHVGVAFRHRVGFVAELIGEYTLQSATVDPIAFSEDYFDVLFGVGWSL